MMVVPFTAGIPTWITQLIYSAVFFILSFLLAQRPEILSKTLGRFMGPLLLVMIAVLFVACMVIPHDAFPAPSGDYAQLQLSRGFLDGYQTMDLLAALYFGIVISANVRQMGITSVSQNRREPATRDLAPASCSWRSTARSPSSAWSPARSPRSTRPPTPAPPC